MEEIVPNWRDYADLMDECSYLHIVSKEEIGPWGLRIRVEESIPGKWPENLEQDYSPEMAAKICMEMGQRPTPRVFEIEFPDAISYHVTNETYGRYPEFPEAFSGKLFRKFERSLLLDWVRKTTYATDDHPGPGPLMHFEVAGQDDVLDVITTREPVIRIVTP